MLYIRFYTIVMLIGNEPKYCIIPERLICLFKLNGYQTILIPNGKAQRFNGARQRGHKATANRHIKVPTL